MTVQKTLKRLDIVLKAALLAASVVIALPVQAEESEGQKAFMEYKCNMCHSIETLSIERTSTSDKMKGPDLSTVGDKHDADWMIKFINKEAQLDGEDHQKTYKGTAEHLEAMVEWLSTLKSAEQK